MNSEKKRISMRVFSRLERFAAGIQGKGTGAFSCPHEVRTIKKLLFGNGNPGEITIFDVGARIGEWTQAALPLFPKARFFLFEPSPKNVHLLNQRFSNLNIEISPLALSDREGVFTLFSDKDGSELASLQQRRLDHFGLNHVAVGEVKTTTIDQFAKSNSLERIDILKIDVEGHELSVLQGASSFLDRIGAIQFEFGGCNIDSRTFFRDFWYLLSPSYRIYRITKFGADLLSAYSESDEFFGTTNYIGINRRLSVC